jgi:hypothetical protein
MSVQNLGLGTINNYLGSSSDTKPTGVTIGSTYYEYDTRNTFITYDGTNWVIKKSEADLAVLATGTFTTSSATVPADTGRTEASNYWNGCILIPLTGAVSMQPRIIKTFTGTTGVFTLDSAFTSAPGAVNYIIIAAQSGSGGLSATSKGVLQEAATTIDLNQAADTYDLFTGTAQVVLLESLVISMPNEVAGGAITSISIQTDDATPQVIISSVDGAVANLTAEAQLAWTGKVRIGVGKKIQLTIAGGAHGSAYSCAVNAECRAVVNGGNLA